MWIKSKNRCQSQMSSWNSQKKRGGFILGKKNEKLIGLRVPNSRSTATGKWWTTIPQIPSQMLLNLIIYIIDFLDRNANFRNVFLQMNPPNVRNWCLQIFFDDWLRICPHLLRPFIYTAKKCKNCSKWPNRKRPARFFCTSQKGKIAPAKKYGQNSTFLKKYSQIARMFAFCLHAVPTISPRTVGRCVVCCGAVCGSAAGSWWPLAIESKYILYEHRRNM